jgi:ribosomal protein L11 methyltransferase
MPSKVQNGAFAWIARLEADAQSVQKLSSYLSESKEAAQDAISLVDNSRGRWQVTIHFGGIPDRQNVRALVATAVGSTAAKRLRFQRLATRDWVKASLEGLKPIRAGRFLVHGAHNRDRLPPNRIGIEIEAALAFGTGHHGTTRGCLLALDRLCKRLTKARHVSSPSSCKGEGRRILDLGTGSGVLAIAAARALRQQVLATDIDAEAVRVAGANARLNRAGAMVEVLRADGLAHHRLRTKAPFDLIFANILLGPLQRLAAPLTKVTAPGARVVLSGLLASQANAAVAAYRPLALERRIDIEGWTTLVLARRIRPRRAVAGRRRGS